MELRKLFRIIFVALVIAGLVSATAAMASTPAAGGDDEKVVSVEATGPAAEMATAKQMRDAQPAPMPEVSGGPLYAEEAFVPTGKALAIAGGLGEAKGSTVDLLGEPEPVYKPGEIHYNYPPPFTRYQLLPRTYYKTYPNTAVGKLWFKGTDGYWYVCSGAVAVGRAVWTAGHCVYNNSQVSGKDGWNSNFTFCPAYRPGASPTPYGCWSWFSAATLTAWVNGYMQYDIGMIAFSDQGGKKIGNVTGWFGAMFNYDPCQHWHNFGYPAASPFDGTKMWVCAGSKAWRDMYFGSPYTSAMGCDMTGGCSGGPWVVNYQPARAGAKNYVNGVNSYRWVSPSQPLAIHSSYFGTGAYNLYQWGAAK